MWGGGGEGGGGELAKCVRQAKLAPTSSASYTIERPPQFPHNSSSAVKTLSLAEREGVVWRGRGDDGGKGREREGQRERERERQRETERDLGIIQHPVNQEDHNHQGETQDVRSPVQSDSHRPSCTSRHAGRAVGKTKLNKPGRQKQETRGNRRSTKN